MKLGSKLIIAFLIVSALIGVIGMISSEISKNMLSDSIGNNSIEVAIQMLDRTDLSLENNLDLFSMLSKEHMTQSILIKSNEEFSKLDNIQKTIDVLDDEWITFPSDQQSSLMIKLINNELSDSFRSHQKFLNEKHGYAYLGEVFVTNAYGANVAQTGKTSDYKQSDEVWWQTAKETGHHVGPIEFDQSAEIFARDVSVSVLDDDGNFLGVVKHVINVQEIFEIIDSVNVLKKFDSQHFTLLNENNQIIYSTTTSYNDSMFLNEYSNEYILEKINKESDYFILSSPTENAKLVSYTTGNGLTHSKWTIIIDYDVSEILLPIENLQIIILSLSGIVTLFAILFGIYISRSISLPVLRLQKEMHEVEKGNFTTNPQKIADNEIGELSRSFEKMSQSIQKTVYLETKLARADEKIKAERFTAIGELSSRISHDIRNPLSILYNEFELMKYKNILDEKQITRIESSLKRISHQIDDVLDFVRITPLHYSQFDLSKIIQNAINSITIPSKIKINFTSDEIFIEGDERKLESVFINLILNAIQAIENDGIVEIIWSITKTSIVIEIKDSGPGIDMKPIENIFNPLVTTKQKGTGLGLASVKNLIEQHNGTISVKNNPTTFTIEIPKKEKTID
jgi:signal transduction histidine kinase